VVAALGAGVSAGTVVEAAAAGIVAIVVPWTNVPAAVTGLHWDGQTVIDATNAWNADLGGRTSSEIVADLVPGARLVKAANTLAADVLAADPHESGGRRVIFLSGDDARPRPQSSNCSTPPASSRSTSVTWWRAGDGSR
jgi:predicted dinucleotide-binding enzyme